MKQPFVVVMALLIGLGSLVSSNAMGKTSGVSPIDSLGRLVSGWRRTIPKDTTYIRLVVDLARAYSKQDSVPQSVYLLKQLIAQVHRRQVRSSPASDQLLKAYYRLMYNQQQIGRLADARQTGQQGIELARLYPRSKWASYLYATMAYLWSTEGDYQQAASLAEQAAAIGVAIGSDPYATANGYYELAKALRSLEKLPEAHQAIDRAIQVGETAPREMDLSLYCTIKATLYQRTKQYGETERWFQKAISLNKALKDTFNLASNYTDLGYFYSITKRYDLAIHTLSSAIRLQPVASVQALALDNLGVVYRKMGQTDRAVQTFQKAMQQLLPAYRPKGAQQWPDSSLTRAASNKEYLLRFLGDLAETWLQQGETSQSKRALDNALRTYLIADQLVDFMRWEQSDQQSKLYWRQKTHSLYERAIETCVRLNDPVMAYQFMEKSRAVLLTDKLNELGARRQLPPELVGQEMAITRSVDQLRTRLSSESPGSAKYRTLQAQLLNEQEKADAFVRQMAKTHPLYYRYRFDNAIRPLAEVRTWLTAHKQSLVSYFVGDSALYILGVTPTGNRLIRQPVNAYTSGLQNWLSGVTNPTPLSAQFTQQLKLGANLYQLLLAPLQLPNGRVMVSPDGFFLPFEALSRSATTPDYLVNSFAFSYVYSVNRMLSDSPDRATDGSFVGLAPVQFRTNLSLSPLVGSSESLEKVGAHYSNQTLLRGERATRAQFRAMAPSASIVQLFTHADADTLQREPVLYFADSSLRLSELQTGPSFQTQLLVLSACRTGVGSHQKGEGVVSLARGFAALGVPSILTTLWSVDSAPTYTLTEDFYAGLASGLDKDIALQQAKQQWLRMASRSQQLPYSWAGMILIGDSQPIRQSSFPGPIIWIGGSVLLLGAGLFLFRRRWQSIGPRPQSGNWKPSLN